MKKIKQMKGIIISFIIGVIIASSIAVYATNYFAKDITYKDNKSVADALNELYDIKNSNYVIKDGKISSNVGNLGTYIDRGYSCSIDYSKNDYIQVNQTGGTGDYATYPYWNLIINLNKIGNYSKAYIDFSYDFTSTYKGLRFDISSFDSNGNLLSNTTKDVSGYGSSTDKKFDRKIIAVDINENNIKTMDLKLKCYTCDSGTSTAHIYNIWFE